MSHGSDKTSRGIASQINKHGNPAHSQYCKSSDEDQEVSSKSENRYAVLSPKDSNPSVMATKVATNLPVIEDITDEDAESPQASTRPTPLGYGPNITNRRKVRDPSSLTSPSTVMKDIRKKID